MRNKKVTEASHRVNDQIAQVGAVHTRTEKLIKVCMVDTAECLLDEKSVKKKITAMPLTNDAVSHQIKDFTANMNYKLLSRLKDYFCFISGQNRCG